ncbi:transporter substrate-binding domain-containing protein [Massilia sp. R798]|uniref:Transporter substrate-binding domain-containing protein n=1 Tax=Massilia soli TaxID=2792854 RepID=A0ABS7SHH5_9BURK|nr:transporter substrate-binding domain-containing protein [Massilia soli]
MRPEWGDTERDPYGVALLKLAFAKAGVCHNLIYSEQRMKQVRAVYELGRDSGKLDIMITMTSPEREAALLGVPVPLTKGLLGWRIALVRKERLHQFAEVRAADQLKKFVAGQGHDWPDTAILRANGLPVEVSSTYEGMFKMLEAGRIDYFPRAIQQVFAEHDEHPALAVEPHIVLRYPADAYFFVNRRNKRLAEEVRRGLESAMADGSFDQLFYSYFAAQIAAAGLDGRRIIELPNPARSPSLPVDRSKLWFSLSELRRPAFIEAASGRTRPPVTADPCKAAALPATQTARRPPD